MFQDFAQFQRLGLQRNPFGTLTPDLLDAAFVPPAGLRDTLAAGTRHVQILGQRGQGKSTLLAGLCRSVREEYGLSTVKIALHPGERRLGVDLRLWDALAIDEAQRLRWDLRPRLMAWARDRVLLIASHADFRPWGRPWGVTFATLQAAAYSGSGQLGEIVRRRLAISTLPHSESGIVFTEEAIYWLHQHFAADVRAALSFLYDVVQTCTAPGDIDVDMLERQARRRGPGHYATRPERSLFSGWGER